MKVNTWGKINGVTFVYLFAVTFVSGLIRVQSLIVKENLYPAFKQKWGRYRELFLHLLFLNCLQLKIILTLKRDILTYSGLLHKLCRPAIHL